MARTNLFNQLTQLKRRLCDKPVIQPPQVPGFKVMKPIKLDKSLDFGKILREKAPKTTKEFLSIIETQLPTH